MFPLNIKHYFWWEKVFSPFTRLDISCIQFKFISQYYWLWYEIVSDVAYTLASPSLAPTQRSCRHSGSSKWARPSAWALVMISGWRGTSSTGSPRSTASSSPSTLNLSKTGTVLEPTPTSQRRKWGKRTVLCEYIYVILIKIYHYTSGHGNTMRKTCTFRILDQSCFWISTNDSSWYFLLKYNRRLQNILIISLLRLRITNTYLHHAQIRR